MVGFQGERCPMVGFQGQLCPMVGFQGDLVLVSDRNNTKLTHTSGSVESHVLS